MKIITAIGNPKINEKLKEENLYEIIGVDIQYQDGIFEILEENKNIDYLILNLDLVGELEKEELIEKILEENKKIKIIAILEKEDEKTINYLFSKNIKNILYKKEININKIKNILLNKEENKLTEKNNKLNKDESKLIEEKNKLNKDENKLIKKNNKKDNLKINKKNNLKEKIENKNIVQKENVLPVVLKKKNQIIKFFNNISKKFNKKNKIINNKKILIIGDEKVGKTSFIILFSKIINKKILIIDFLNNSKEINIMFGKKLEDKEQIIKIDKKIDLIKCNIESLARKDLINIFKNYNYIFFDSSNIKEKNKINKIIKNIDKYILIIEPNLIGINNSKKILENIFENKKIDKKNINIILNKFNYFSINEKIIKYIFSDYKIIGKIKQNNKYNFLINNNFNLIDLKIKKEFLKIIKEEEK